jgi:hypothetical protein
MSTVRALGVSIGVLLRAEGLLISSSLGLGSLRVATHVEANALAPSFERGIIENPTRLRRVHVPDWRGGLAAAA